MNTLLAKLPSTLTATETEEELSPDLQSPDDLLSSYYQEYEALLLSNQATMTQIFAISRKVFDRVSFLGKKGSVDWTGTWDERTRAFVDRGYDLLTEAALHVADTTRSNDEQHSAARYLKIWKEHNVASLLFHDRINALLENLS